MSWMGYWIGRINTVSDRRLQDLNRKAKRVIAGSPGDTFGPGIKGRDREDLRGTNIAQWHGLLNETNREIRRRKNQGIRIPD